jgi:hypothetical protein
VSSEEIKFNFTAKGRIRYSTPKSQGGNGWVVIDCPFDIMFYYNRICNWLLWTGGRITYPLHGSHITVVSGKHTECDESNWGYRDGEYVDFEYGTIHGEDGYYWLPVRCEAAVDIRTKLGLDPKPFWNYHLTVGFENF